MTSGQSTKRQLTAESRVWPLAVLFAAPLAGLAGLFVVEGWAWAAPVLALAGAVALVVSGPGKYPALLAGMMLWQGLGCLMVWRVAVDWPVWISLPILVVAFCWPVLPAMRLGQVWGLRRYAAKAAKGRPIREWQWVYVEREAALSHRFARRSLGIYVSAAFLIARTMMIGVAIVAGAVGGWWMVWPLAVAVLDVATLIALWRPSPVAYPLMFLALALAFPLSAPLMIYWADGVRPNLIYRHRFERLVPLEGA